MESIKGQEGIQMLLGAEQEAQRIIVNARNCNSFFIYYHHQKQK